MSFIFWERTFCDTDLFKANEPQYKRCGVTPHFGNFVQAVSAITNDNDSSS